MVERKYIDVNVFVYWLGRHPEYGERSREWIRRIENGSRGEYITSALTLHELAVVLSGLAAATLKDPELIWAIVNAVTALPGLEIVPLEKSDHLKAVKLMKEYRLDYEDSLHLAVMLRMRAEKIVSNDADFDRTPLKRIF